MCGSLPITLAQFKTKICDFCYSNYDLTLTSIPCFRSAPRFVPFFRTLLKAMFILINKMTKISSLFLTKKFKNKFLGSFCCYYCRRSVLVSGPSSPGSSPCGGHCVIFLGKTLNSYSASLHQVYKWVPAYFIAGVNPVMD